MRKILLATALFFLSTNAFALQATSTPPSKPTLVMNTKPLIDINHASSSELASLKGIGPSRAADIIKGRPYFGKDDLKNKKIIPANVYSDIQQQIIAKQK